VCHLGIFLVDHPTIYRPCLIFEKIEKDEMVMYKLACQYDKLQNNFAVEHFVDLKSACPDELKQIIVDDLQDITIVEACKLMFVDRL
jgi:hypothetical protein